MADFVDGSELLPQPETYPPPRQSPPSSPKISTHTPSSFDEYLQINSIAARDLPAGESCIYYQLVLVMIKFCKHQMIFTVRVCLLHAMMYLLYPPCPLRNQE